MCWGWKMPASMWYMCGRILGYLYDVDPQTQTDYPYFSDKAQAAIFLIIYIFSSKIFLIGWEMFQIFDLNERHKFNKMDLNLYVKDEIKSVMLWLIFGTPAFFLIMFVIEWGGDFVPLFMLIVSVSFMFIYKYLYINIIGPMYNKYEKLSEEKYAKLKKDIECLCRDVKFPITNIYVVDQSKRSGHSNA